MSRKTYCPAQGKERFSTRAEAEKALRHMRRKSKPGGSVYQCETCGGYHMTHLSYGYGKNLRTKIKKGRI